MLNPYDVSEASLVLIAAVEHFMKARPIESKAAAKVDRLGAALISGADIHIASATAGSSLLDLATAMQGGLPDIDVLFNLTDSVIAISAVSNPALAVRNTCEWLALSLTARKCAETAFRSHEETMRLKRRFTVRLDPALVRASDTGQPELFRALKSLYAMIVQDLAIRGRTLPRLVNYDRNTVLPWLGLAHGIYYDSHRADELVEENGVVNPLFMPRSGRALSA